MRKIKNIIALTFLITSSANAQNNQDYRSCVKEFYKYIFSEKKVYINDFSRIYSNSLEPSFIMEEKSRIGLTYLQAQREVDAFSDTIISRTLLRMRVYKQKLAQGSNYESVCKQIESSSVYNEGTEFSMLLELKLSENNIVFFEINQDTPKQIQYIWLCTGESLGDLVQGIKSVEKFKRPGTISDPDGYVNVRIKPDKSSQIVGKFIKDEIFYYTPISGSEWYPVYKEEGGKQFGYIHRSRILKYIEFTPKLKEKVKKQRGGC